MSSDEPDESESLGSDSGSGESGESEVSDESGREVPTAEGFDAYLEAFEQRHRGREYAVGGRDLRAAFRAETDEDRAFLEDFVEFDWAANRQRDRLATPARGGGGDAEGALDALLDPETDRLAAARARSRAAPCPPRTGRFDDDEIRAIISARTVYLHTEEMDIADLRRGAGGLHKPHWTRIAGLAALPGRDLESVQRKARELTLPPTKVGFRGHPVRR